MNVFTRNSRCGRSGRCRRGQNVTEYIILVAGVLTVVILAVNSRGIFTQGANRAIGIMMNSVEMVTTEECLGPADNVPGAWGPWSSWTPCSSCSQTRSRACDSPAPRCGGAVCAGGDGSIETVSQSCTGSGIWVVGSCGVCTGACGSTTGTCPQTVICSGGCCDPMTEPPSAIVCPKALYPDTWVELNNWVCSVPCGGAGTETQTVTCGGSCCDQAAKPPSSRPCNIVCGDGLFCNGVEYCDAALGGCQPGTPPVCDDGLFCNGVETCSPASGSCQPGTPPAVDDGISCTTDYCDPVLDQAVHTPIYAACDDGLFCNGAEICDAALGCQAGSAPVLDDGIACTIDSCDEANKIVVHAPNNVICGDYDPCNGVETCHPIDGCHPGAPVVCEDGDVCNGIAACDPADGQCLPGTPLVCDDGDMCTTDSCDPASGCQFPAKNCDDSNACTIDTCAPASGVCQYAVLNCNDGIWCNGLETCDVVSGCQVNPRPIDDQIMCTVDVCDEANRVIFHTPSDGLCNDNLACTGRETCNITTGCRSLGVPAAYSAGGLVSYAYPDNVACTTQTCVEIPAPCGKGWWPTPPCPVVTTLFDNTLCLPNQYCGYHRYGYDLGCFPNYCGGSPSSTPNSSKCALQGDVDDETPLITTRRYGPGSEFSWHFAAGCTTAGKCEVTCNTGYVWNGLNYNYAMCNPIVPPPIVCTVPGTTQTVAPGVTIYRFIDATVPCGSTCTMYSRICQADGTWSGDPLAILPSCSSTALCLSCPAPDGGTPIYHGGSRLYYDVQSRPCGPDTCSLHVQARVCNNGTLSGDDLHIYPGCTQQACGACLSGTFNSANTNICPGDDSYIPVNASNTLVSACSAPAGSSPYCEYACNTGYTNYNNQLCYRCGDGVCTTGPETYTSCLADCGCNQFYDLWEGTCASNCSLRGCGSAETTWRNAVYTLVSDPTEPSGFKSVFQNWVTGSDTSPHPGEYTYLQNVSSVTSGSTITVTHAVRCKCL